MSETGVILNPLATWFGRHPDVRNSVLSEYAGVSLVSVTYWRTDVYVPTIAHREQIERFTRHYGADAVTLDQWVAHIATRSSRRAA